RFPLNTRALGVALMVFSLGLSGCNAPLPTREAPSVPAPADTSADMATPPGIPYKGASLPAPAALPATAPSPTRLRTATQGAAVNGQFVRGAPIAALAAPMADTAKYDTLTDNGIQQAAEQSLSTFSLDVDTGSYANTRRFLADNRLPPPDAVRVEELLNYFPAEPSTTKRLDGAPFAVDYEVTQAPWDASKVLLRVNLQAIDIDAQRAPAAHLTFLVDVSGSMDEARKLPLVKQSLKMLVAQLRAQDTVSLVTYAGNTRVVLPPTSGAEKNTIANAIDDLNAGGGTAGESGLKLAYDMARQNFVKGDVNRVLLATDGDFNLGVTNTEALKAIVKRERESGITLSTLGYGGSNFNDALMEQIADVGNGNFSYIDSVREAEKVLKDEMGATLITVAKDVKAQIEFNPARVQEWRQIGYENRQLKREDFNNDAVDAGDIGSGKRVTVLYELRLRGEKNSIDPLRYGQAPRKTGNATPNAFSEKTGELAFLKLRWKAPDGNRSELASLPLTGAASAAAVQSFDQASNDTRFLTAVAAFGQKLRNNPAVSQSSWEDIAHWARGAKGIDPNGYRAEFVQLVKDARRLAAGGAS
ncbi:MAG: VWA domain-containing protein, partial [Hydrogenophaga sp.]